MLRAISLEVRASTSLIRAILVVWDNCGPHKTAAVKAAFEREGFEQEELPPKMTDILQVMDLLANGPVKSGIRRVRCEMLFEYFQNWKIARLQAAANKTALPPFKPPKPTLASGIKTLLHVLKTSLATDKFIKSLENCFIHIEPNDPKVDVNENFRSLWPSQLVPKCLGSLYRPNTHITSPNTVTDHSLHT